MGRKEKINSNVFGYDVAFITHKDIKKLLQKLVNGLKKGTKLRLQASYMIEYLGVLILIEYPSVNYKAIPFFIRDIDRIIIDVDDFIIKVKRMLKELGFELQIYRYDKKTEKKQKHIKII